MRFLIGKLAYIPSMNRHFKSHTILKIGGFFTLWLITSSHLFAQSKKTPLPRFTDKQCRAILYDDSKNGEYSDFLVLDSIAGVFGMQYTVIRTISRIPIYDSNFRIIRYKNKFASSLLKPVQVYTTNLGDYRQFLKYRLLSQYPCFLLLEDGYRSLECRQLLNVEHGDFVELVVDSNNVIYSLRHLQQSLIDTVVHVNIFKPNPIVALNLPYGIGLRDSMDLNSLKLSQALSLDTLTFRSTNNALSFAVGNGFATMREMSAPAIDTFLLQSDSTLFRRDQPEFEAINVLYHISRFSQYLNSVHLNPINRPIIFDPHALSGQDQSLCIPALDTIRLLFGQGGVDDGEDADVIVHEFSHGISSCLSPNSQGGFERQAMDEAFGDYLAKAYSYSIDPYKWQDVFSWDGHNEFWAGRDIASTKHYPENLGGSYHLAGEIFSSTLMQLHFDIGRTTLDSVLFFAWQSINSTSTMRQAAALLLEADSILFNKAHYPALIQRFCNRGFMNCLGYESTQNTSPVMLTNSFDFSSHSGEALLRNLSPHHSYSIQLFDATGRVVYSTQVANVTELGIPNRYTSGVYYLGISWNQNIQTFKLPSF